MATARVKVKVGVLVKVKVGVLVKVKAGVLVKVKVGVLVKIRAMGWGSRLWVTGMVRMNVRIRVRV